jgi:hypothetical protein
MYTPKRLISLHPISYPKTAPDTDIWTRSANGWGQDRGRMQCRIRGQQGGDQSVGPNEARIRRGVPCRDRVSPYREHCGSGASTLNLQRSSPGADELCARSGANAGRTVLQFAAEVPERR